MRSRLLFVKVVFIGERGKKTYLINPKTSDGGGKFWLHYKIVEFVCSFSYITKPLQLFAEWVYKNQTILTKRKLLNVFYEFQMKNSWI